MVAVVDEPGHRDLGRLAGGERGADRLGAHVGRQLGRRRVGGVLDREVGLAAERRHLLGVLRRQHITGGVYVHAVGARTGVVADFDTVHCDVIRVNNLRRPEARPLQAEILHRHVFRLPNHYHAHSLGIIISRPAQAAWIIIEPSAPIPVPPFVAPAIDHTAA